MTLPNFIDSLKDDAPPAGLGDYLQSLWYDGKGNWEKSHIIIQDIGHPLAAWIHAYLHRKEEDLPNADYWYRRAGKKRPDISLQQEWEELVEYVLLLQ